MSVLTAASFADALRASRATLSSVDAAALLLGPVDRTYKRDKDGRFGSGGGGSGGASGAPATSGEGGSVAALPRMEIPSVTEGAKGTNPNYGASRGGPTYREEARAGKAWDSSMGAPPSGAYEENCTNAVQGFEMRMRGYDVTAAPLHVLDKYGYASGRTVAEVDHQLATSWTLPGGAPHGRSIAGQPWRSLKEIDAEVQAWPEGGRGFVTVGKHVFNVVKSGGKSVYVEAQFDASPTRVMTREYKKKYKSEPFGSPPKVEEAKMIRLDDLEPSDGILSSVVARS